MVCGPRRTGTVAPKLLSRTSMETAFYCSSAPLADKGWYCRSQEAVKRVFYELEEYRLKYFRFDCQLYFQGKAKEPVVFLSRTVSLKGILIGPFVFTFEQGFRNDCCVFCSWRYLVFHCLPQERPCSLVLKSSKG